MRIRNGTFHLVIEACDGMSSGNGGGEPEIRTRRTADQVPIAMDAAAFRKAGHALVDRLAAFLESVPDRPVAPGHTPERVRELLDADASLPDEGEGPEAALERATELLTRHSLHIGHPRFFGYVTSSPAPVGMLGDMLAAAVNPNMGAWVLSPMATEMEAQAVRWVAELLGYPADCGGLMVSGGNMANMVGLWAARASVGADWAVREDGMAGPEGRALRIYASRETHTWLEKATDLAGLGTGSVRWLEPGRDLRLDPERVREVVRRDLEEGLRPMMVVGTAGTVSTGAVDPLRELAAFCREEDLWFHVDGAYGGFAAAAPGASPDLAAMAEADSVAVDPHKWLYAPLEVGCALVRRPDDLRNAFSYHPPYYFFGQEAINYVDFGPQNSRGFRALKVWLALRQVGRQGYARMIGQDLALARRLRQRVEAHPELEPGPGGLSITTFRYVPGDVSDTDSATPGSTTEEDRDGAHTAVSGGMGGATAGSREEYLNELNQDIQARLERDGEAFVSNAVVGGRYLLRACIVNFNTTAGDVDVLPEIVARVGREAHRQIRRRRG